jgi:hypothetical protein
VDSLRTSRPFSVGQLVRNCPDDRKEKIVAPFLLTLWTTAHLSCVVNNITSCETFSVTSNSVIEAAIGKVK